MIGGEQRSEGRITVFHLREDLTNTRVKHFLKKMYDLVDEGRKYLILDLSEVEEVSLMGMVAISSVSNRCRQAGGALKICHLQPFVRRAFRSTNLINTVEVFEDSLDAIKSFKSRNLLKSQQYSGSFFIKEKNAFVPWDRIPVVGHYN